MFQFPSLPPAPYVFRYGYRRITSGEFPHSEIPGSMTGQRLPRAYRSRPRPSSALGAKASIVCPCSLDQKNTGNRCRYGVFKVHADEGPPYTETPAESTGLSKLNSARTANVEVDVVLGESDGPTASRVHRGAIKGSDAYRNGLPDSLERR